MQEDPDIGWVMATIIGVMGLVVLALLYVPGVRPEQAVLECDAKGGFWSSDTRLCTEPDSPLAGMAS
ncbi:MAG: hypothetical protein AAFV62_14625 [Pseudomonadota bacterium]